MPKTAPEPEKEIPVTVNTGSLWRVRERNGITTFMIDEDDRKFRRHELLQGPTCPYYIPSWLDNVIGGGAWTEVGDEIIWDDYGRCMGDGGTPAEAMAVLLAAHGRRDTFEVAEKVTMYDTVVITRKKGLRRVRGRTWEDDQLRVPYKIPKRGPSCRPTSPLRFEDLKVGDVAIYRPEYDSAYLHSRFKSWARVRGMVGAKVQTKMLRGVDGSVVAAWVYRVA